MKNKKKVLVFEKTEPMTFRVPGNFQRSVSGAIMKHHIGRSSVPLEEDFDFPQELKDAHWLLNAGQIKKVKYKFYSDGSFECEVLNGG